MVKLRSTCIVFAKKKKNSPKSFTFTLLICPLFLPLFPFSGVDMTTILFKLGFDEALVRSKLAAGTSTFVLAYAIHKLFAPVRISITVVSVPFLVRYFRKIGFFKPPSPNP